MALIPVLVTLTSYPLPTRERRFERGRFTFSNHKFRMMQNTVWTELVNHCKPIGTVDMRFTKPVEEAISNFIQQASDGDKRAIWREIEFEAQSDDGNNDVTISEIDMGLKEELFEKIIELAFQESEHRGH